MCQFPSSLKTALAKRRGESNFIQIALKAMLSDWNRTNVVFKFKYQLMTQIIFKTRLSQASFHEILLFSDRIKKFKKNECSYKHGGYC